MNDKRTTSGWWRMGAVSAAVILAAGCGPRPGSGSAPGVAAPAVAASAAAPVPDCLVGVWAGELGSTAIRMEFVQPGGTLAGRYYYRDGLQELMLTRAPDGGWREHGGRDKGAETGRLSLHCDADAVNGEWRSPGGGRTLSVALRRVGEDQFDQPRVAALRRPVVALGGASTMPLVMPGLPAVRGVQFHPGDLRYESLNAMLWRRFVEDVGAALQCATEGFRAGGADSNNVYESTRRVLRESGDLIVVTEQSLVQCGGPHPASGRTVRVLRRSDGSAVDTASWFIDVAFEQELDDQLRAAYAKKKREDACDDPQMLFAPSAVWPGARGLVFRADLSSWDAAGCDATVELPLASISRFLSPQGKRALGLGGDSKLD